MSHYAAKKKKKEEKYHEFLVFKDASSIATSDGYFEDISEETNCIRNLYQGTQMYQPPYEKNNHMIYLSRTLTPLYVSYGISTVGNSKGYVFLSYISPGTSNSRTGTSKPNHTHKWIIKII